MFQQAANRAGLRLMEIDLYEGRTVYHDFWTQFSHTRIFVKQKPIGHGVVAHRVIKSACELIGIKDLEAVVEGSHNPNSMIKAFFSDIALVLKRNPGYLPADPHVASSLWCQ